MIWPLTPASYWPVTSQLKLGTGIALLLERELFSQAKTIATLDRLLNVTSDR